jgi:serine/threonine protein phosphatase PrpC
MGRPSLLFTGQWADLPVADSPRGARVGASTASSSPAGATTFEVEQAVATVGRTLGDSAVCLFRQGQMHRLTRDHSASQLRPDPDAVNGARFRRMCTATASRRVCALARRSG